MLRIAIDIDEVLCPMLRSLDRHYTAVHKRRAPAVLPKVYNYASRYNISNMESKLLVRSFYCSEHCHEMETLAFSKAAVHSLKKKYSLSIVTGRQIYARDATLSFLDKHYPNVFDTVMLTNSFSLYGKELPKHAACAMIGASVLIDDSVDNIKSANEHGMHGILFGTYPWNCEALDVDRMDSWYQTDRFL